MSVSEVIVLLASTLLLAAVYVRLRLLMCLTMPLEVEAFRVASPEETRPRSRSHTALSPMSRPIRATVYISEANSDSERLFAINVILRAFQV